MKSVASECGVWSLGCSLQAASFSSPTQVPFLIGWVPLHLPIHFSLSLSPSLSVPLPLYSLGARLGEDSGLKITLVYWRVQNISRNAETDMIVLMKCSQGYGCMC